jgi:hypothetical protein
MQVTHLLKRLKLSDLDLLNFIILSIIFISVFWEKTHFSAIDEQHMCRKFKRRRPSIWNEKLVNKLEVIEPGTEPG